MLKIALLGSTGSIGKQVLSVVKRYKDKFKIVSLTANTNSELLLAQAAEFKPEIITLEEGELNEKINGVKTYCGKNSYLEAITETADLIFVAVVGYSGLKAVMQAIKLGKRIALANKEALVAGGELVMSFANLTGVEILPVDSEHSAIWQCLDYRKRDFKKLLLTASGGAFRDYDSDQLKRVTPEQALKHPNWNMGKRITVDCATLVNKGFEVIEAKWLFNAPLNKIEVVLHDESIIHSMVEFEDNSVIAQLARPSMVQPIQLALTYPEKLESEIPPLDFAALKSLNFRTLDLNKYPCFNLAMEAAKMGGVAPCALNAADECAVKRFLNGEIGFCDIPRIIELTLSKLKNINVTEDNLDRTDEWARAVANEY